MVAALVLACNGLDDRQQRAASRDPTSDNGRVTRVVSIDRLRAHVQHLAGEIGERNVYHPGTLEAAARYIEDQWTAQGYQVRRISYEVAGVECARQRGLGPHQQRGSFRGEQVATERDLARQQCVGRLGRGSLRVGLHDAHTQLRRGTRGSVDLHHA